MIITLFILPALLPLSLAGVIPHELSSRYDLIVDSLSILGSRNIAPADYVPEDGVNLAATNGPGDNDEDEDCDEDEDGSTHIPEEVNLAATDGPADNKDDDEDCDEEEEDGTKGMPSDINLAATDGPPGGDDNAKNAIPADLNLAATGPPENARPAEVKNVAEAQSEPNGGAAVVVPANKAATSGAVTNSASQSASPTSEATPDAIPTALNNVAVGQSKEGTGVNVGVPADKGDGGDHQPRPQESGECMHQYKTGEHWIDPLSTRR